MFIITGSFGVSAAKSATKCKIVTFMVLCIISATMSAAVVIVSSFAAASDFYNGVYNCNRTYSYYYTNYRYYETLSDSQCQVVFNVRVAMNALVACLGFIGGVAAIWGSVICCKACCCGRSSSGSATNLPVQYVTTSGNQQIIVIPQQQGLGVPVQQQQAYTGYQPLQQKNSSAPPYHGNTQFDGNRKY